MTWRDSANRAIVAAPRRASLCQFPLPLLPPEPWNSTNELFRHDECVRLEALLLRGSNDLPSVPVARRVRNPRMV